MKSLGDLSKSLFGGRDSSCVFIVLCMHLRQRRARRLCTTCIDWVHYDQEFDARNPVMLTSVCMRCHSAVYLDAGSTYL